MCHKGGDEDWGMGRKALYLGGYPSLTLAFSEQSPVLQCSNTVASTTSADNDMSISKRIMLTRNRNDITKASRFSTQIYIYLEFIKFRLCCPLPFKVLVWVRVVI